MASAGDFIGRLTFYNSSSVGLYGEGYINLGGCELTLECPSPGYTRLDLEAVADDDAERIYNGLLERRTAASDKPYWLGHIKIGSKKHRIIGFYQPRTNMQNQMYVLGLKNNIFPE